MFDFGTVLAIGVAGGLASVLRLILSRWHSALPWGVLTANILASGLLGFFIIAGNISATWGWAQTVGFAGICGGLSTFSSVVAASGEYLRGKQWAKALIYTVLSVALPFTALITGMNVAPLLLN